MIHPQGFKDSKNIHIKNNSAYHFVVGDDTYLNRFINSLRLEDKYENDEAFQDMLINVVNVKREKFLKLLEPEPKPIKTYDDHPDLLHHDGYKVMLRKSRLSKKMRNLKKRENSNTKKNKVKQNGYDEKMKNINFSIPPTFPVNEKHPSFNYDDWDEYWIGNDKYLDTSDMYDDNRSYTSSEYEEYAFECAVEYARGMISRW